jgi:predicted dehydrogenase
MINTAIIGKGYWGSKLISYINNNEHFNVKAVYDSKSVISMDDIDAVVIATPNSTHYELTKQALLARKHILVEKPLALEVSQCEELKELAEQNGVKIEVEYTYTFSEGMVTIQDNIDKIGELKSIELNCKHLGRFGGGSVYWLLGSHMLSILDMFTPIKDLWFNKFDTVVVDGAVETGSILYEGQFNGIINLSLNQYEKDNRVIFYGTKGTIVYDPNDIQSINICHYNRDIWTVDVNRSHSYYYIDEGNNIERAINEFYKVINGESESNIDRAIEITEILASL